MSQEFPSGHVTTSINAALFTALPPEHLLFQKRSLVTIFRQATQDFLRHGAPFLMALVVPVFLIYGGCYGALLAALSSTNEGEVLKPLALTLLGLILMFIGAWQFVVYFASMNRSYADLLEKKPISCKKDYQALLRTHKNPLIWYINGLVILQFIAFIVFSVLTIPFSFFIPPPVINLLIQVLIVSIYAIVSPGFQILALDTPKSGPLGVIIQSQKLALPHLGKCLLTLLISLAIAYYLIPGIVISIAEATGAIEWFNQWHEGLITAYVNRILENAPDILPMDTLAKEMNPIVLSHQLSQTLLSNFINSFLLPWGTFVYALLYGDMVVKTPKSQE